MDCDVRIPYGGSLGCLPDLLLLGFGFVFGSRSSSSAAGSISVWHTIRTGFRHNPCMVAV